MHEKIKETLASWPKPCPANIYVFKVTIETLEKGANYVQG